MRRMSADMIAAAPRKEADVIEIAVITTSHHQQRRSEIIPSPALNYDTREWKVQDGRRLLTVSSYSKNTITMTT